ncbi:MAG: hypothetical protein JXN64_03710 [Spirochaetes bacterium]|nr:hypothetical protein [Spirochaetota bacterium]
MYKLSIILLVLIVFSINCNGNKEPVITLGKSFNKATLEVSDETDIFNRNDIFAYSLSQRDPFDVEIINQRIYQGKEYIDMIRKESVDITVPSGSSKIGDAIPVEKLIQKYGSGNFLLLFAINDSVIAKKAFVIEGRAPKTDKGLHKQKYEEIMPMRTGKDMPMPNMYGTDEAALNQKTTPGKTEKYIPETDTRDNVPDQRLTPGRQEKKNIPIMSPSEMMK